MKALVIIAPQGYQDHELAGTRQGLEAGGFEVVLASTEVGPCQGSLGGSETSQIALRDVKVKDYDRVAFIGGPGAVALAANSEALNIAHETVRHNIPLGAICIAPLILAKAKVLGGKQATVWNEDGAQAPVLEQYGAIYTGQDVTVAGSIVTANGPHAAEAFGKAMASPDL